MNKTGILSLLVLLICGCSATPTAIPVPTIANTPTPIQTPMSTRTSTPMPMSTPTLIPSPTLTFTPTPLLVTNVKDIVGVWFGTGRDGLYQKFNSDGTHQIALGFEGLNGQPDIEGTFRFEGTRLILQQVGASPTKRLPNCSGQGVYQVHALTNGNIKFVKISETCSGRGLSTAQEHERVSFPATPTPSITVFQPGVYTMTDNNGEWVMAFSSDGSMT